MKLVLLISLSLFCACIDSSQNTFETKELNERIVSHIDNAEMQLIPSGTFLMGNSDEDVGDADELPVHEVYLDAFYIDIFEVTNAKYQQFVLSTGYPSPPLWNDQKFNQPDSPVVNIKWVDAVAYAKWANKRLPTEAEWEYAARGNLIGKKFPTGDIMTHDDANFGGEEGKDIWRWTSPVGSFRQMDLVYLIWLETSGNGALTNTMLNSTLYHQRAIPDMEENQHLIIRIFAYCEEADGVEVAKIYAFLIDGTISPQVVLSVFVV